MFKYLLWAWPLGIVLFLISFICFIVPGLILRVLGFARLADSIMYFTVRWLCRFSLWVIGVKVEVSGNIEEVQNRYSQGESFCFISNHLSMLDILVFYGYVNVKAGFMAKKEVKRIPLINFYAYALHCVFIDRKDMRKAKSVLSKCCERIQNGISMLVFPEGTRSKTGEILPFKHGSFRIASETGASVVPITIKGTRAPLEERTKCFGKYRCFLNVGELKSFKCLDRFETFDLIMSVEKQITSTYDVLGR